MKNGICILMLLLASVSLGQESPSWTSKGYHVLKDGNVLYGECQSYEKNVRVVGENFEVRSGAGTDLYLAGECSGYVISVVDSIPGGEGFDPDPDVKASQEVDVVIAYLREHPEQRHLSAYYLVRTALTEAFPKRLKAN